MTRPVHIKGRQDPTYSGTENMSTFLAARKDGMHAFSCFVSPAAHTLYCLLNAGRILCKKVSVSALFL